MKLRDIIELLEEHFPPEYAEEWDNSGLIEGDIDSDITKVMLALDATDEVIGKAISDKCDLIVTHHPMIFSGIKSVRQDDYTGRRLIAAIKNDIAIYSIHTNYDTARMGDINAVQLGLADPETLSPIDPDVPGNTGIGKIGSLKEEMTLRDYAVMLKKEFRLSGIRVYGDPDMIVRRAAVCSGSGKSYIDEALSKGADVMVTGDVDYHTAIDSKMKGIAVIDGGHYGTEFVFIEDMYGFFGKHAPGVEAVKYEIEQPYEIV